MAQQAAMGPSVLSQLVHVLLTTKLPSPPDYYAAIRHRLAPPNNRTTRSPKLALLSWLFTRECSAMPGLYSLWIVGRNGGLLYSRVRLCFLGLIFCWCSAAPPLTRSP